MEDETLYNHIYLPGNENVVILFHGTGGDEYDLVTLAQMVAPGATILSLRGKEQENGMNRFFKRFAEQSFDEENIRMRAQEIKRFLRAAAKKYQFTVSKSFLLGYSNGANMIAALMLLYPEHFRNGMLFRGMMPFIEFDDASKEGIRIFLSAGKYDQLISPDRVAALEAYFTRNGADVEIFWSNAGHEFHKSDMVMAQSWFKRNAVKQ